MKTAGVVIDFYDDVTGALLRRAYPTQEDLPELVKEADSFHFLHPEEREVLRDDAYALVMNNGGKVLRKFACVDPGNTLLSMLYFVENAHLLPVEAIKVAAVNLESAGARYGLEHPFIKQAAKKKEVDPSWSDAQYGMTRAMRSGDKGVGQFLAANELIGSRVKRGLVGGVGGALAGRALGGGKGAFVGSVLGGTAGLTSADIAYLKKKGVKPKMLGLAGAKFSPKAAKKYLDRPKEKRSSAGEFEKDGAKDGKKGSAASRVRDPALQPIVGDEADWAARTNLVSVRGGADSGRVIPAAQQMKTASVEKIAISGQTVGSAYMKRVAQASRGGMMRRPASPSWSQTAQKVEQQHPIYNKWLDRSRAREEAFHAGGSTELGKIYERQGKRWAGEPGLAKVSGVVDVTGKEPVTLFEKRAAKNTVLGKYPLDSYADVRSAVDYFKDHWTDFDPVERHVFAVKTAARAEEIGLDVPDLMLRYGSQQYAPDVEAHLANRKAVAEERFHELFDAMKEKRAGIAPEVFADLLMQADIAAGLNWFWGGEIADPYFATFGGRTDKEKVAYAWSGNGFELTEEQMRTLVENEERMLGAFEPALVEAFKKDPVTIFESLPLDAKCIIAQLASGA